MIQTLPNRPAVSAPVVATARLRLALVTPARNEAAFIGATIRSVVAQTVRPVRWVIVSDGSTDGTDDIVRDFARQHAWIELVRMPDHRDRTFAAKANCFNAGYARLRDTEYDLVGNLDADITFEPDYLAFLIARMESNPRLGVVGTPFVEDQSQPGHHSYAHGRANLEHVSGACQIFRRACFEAVGGYVPVKGGAIDWIAVTTARMNGWQTRTFVEKVCHHHRTLGTGNNRALFVPFHYGRKAYYVGGHPVWALLRGFFQMRNRPVIVGGLLFQMGFFWALVTRMPRVTSKELMAFHRKEQLDRLKAILPFSAPRPSQPSPTPVS